MHFQCELARACQEGADQAVARGSSPLAGGGARGARVTGAPLQEPCVTISCLSNLTFSFSFQARGLAGACCFWIGSLPRVAFSALP